MKRIEIVIPDRKLYAVSDVFEQANVGGMTYYGVMGRSQIKPKHDVVGMGTMRYEQEFNQKYKVEVVVKDEQVDGLIAKIVERVGDDLATGAKIFVVDVSDVVDLRSKKRGDAAI